jgi:hypothetical protein
MRVHALKLLLDGGDADAQLDMSRCGRGSNRLTSSYGDAVAVLDRSRLRSLLVVTRIPTHQAPGGHDLPRVSRNVR